MQSRFQAVTVASVFALLSLLFPPLNIVSSASVALVTLRRGAIEGCVVFISSCLVCTLVGFFLVNSYQFGLFYGLILWMPVWLVSVVLRGYRNLFLAVECIIAIASVTVFLAYLFRPDLADIWKDMLNALLEPMLAKSNPSADIQAIKQSLSVFYCCIITGLIAQVYVFILLASLFLGRWWQAILYNPGGFKKEYLSVKGQPLLAIITAIIFLVGMLSGGVIAQISWGIVLLLFTLYAFVGTIVLHCVLMTLKIRQFAVPFLYVTIMIIPYVVIPVAVVGLTDTWLNLRNKIPNQTSI